MADEEEITPPNSDDPPAPENDVEVSGEMVQVPTALDPRTWPEKTGTVTDPKILAEQGLAPDDLPKGQEPLEHQQKSAEQTDVQGPAPEGAEWFQCLVDHLPTKHKFWSVDHLKDPPERISCPYCGSQTVVRAEGYVTPAFLKT